MEDSVTGDGDRDHNRRADPDARLRSLRDFVSYESSQTLPGYARPVAVLRRKINRVHTLLEKTERLNERARRGSRRIIVSDSEWLAAVAEPVSSFTKAAEAAADAAHYAARLPSDSGRYAAELVGSLREKTKRLQSVTDWLANASVEVDRVRARTLPEATQIGSTLEHFADNLLESRNTAAGAMDKIAPLLERIARRFGP